MDKTEYRMKLDELNFLVENQNYKGALEIADSIDWRRVKSIRTLSMVADVYEVNKEYERCREILLLAYGRSMIGKSVLYRLVEISLKLGETEDANEYFSEFVEAAPNDNSRFILKYKLYKAQKAPIEDQIAVLEDYKEREYTERWAYELAKLYSQAGDQAKCVETCDDLILWFAEGRYVLKAMELKMQYEPLSPSQRQKYESSLAGRSASAVSRGAVSPIPAAAAPLAQLGRLETEKTGRRRSRENTEELLQKMESAGAAITQEASTARARLESSRKEERLDHVPVNSPEFLGKTVDLKEQLAKSIQEVFAGMKAPGSPAAAETPAVGGDTGEIVIQDLEPETVETSASLNTDGAKTILTKAEPKKADVPQKEATAAESVSGEETGETIPELENFDLEALLKETASDLSEALAAHRTEANGHQEEEETGATDGTGESGEASGAEETQEEVQSDRSAEQHSGEAEDNYSEEAYTEETEAGYGEEAYTEEAEESSSEEVYAEEAGGDYSEEAYAEEAEADYGEEAYAEEAEGDYSEEAYTEEAEADYSEEAYAEEAEGSSGEEAYTEEAEAGYGGEAYAEEAEGDYSEEVYAEEAEGDYGEEGYTEEAEGYYGEEAYAEEAEGDYGEEAYAEGAEGYYGEEVYAEETEGDYGEEVYAEETEGDYGEEAYAEETEGDYSEEAYSEDYYGEEEYPEEAYSEDAEDAADKTRTFETIREEASDATREITPKNIMSSTRKFVAAEGTIPMSIEEVLREETPEERRIRLMNQDRPEKFTESQKKLFSYFAKIPGMDQQVLDALAGTYAHVSEKTSKHGNIAIMGGYGTGKTRLSQGIVKAICKDLGLAAAKYAHMDAADLNKKDPAAIVAKLSGGFLMIERAGLLYPDVINKLNQAMEFRTDSLIVIIEDEKKSMRTLLRNNPAFAAKFETVISIPVFTNDELVTFARTYARENGYKMDEMGVLALYTLIGDNQTEDEPMTIAKVKEIVDKAIHKAGKGTRRFGRRVSGKRTDDQNRIILYEKDFDI